MSKPEFFQPGDFFKAHPCEPAFKHMILLPLRQDQVPVGAAILLMNDDGEVVRVCMKFLAEATGEVHQLVIAHGCVRIEGYMTQAIGRASRIWSRMSQSEPASTRMASFFTPCRTWRAIAPAPLLVLIQLSWTIIAHDHKRSMQGRC